MTFVTPGSRAGRGRAGRNSVGGTGDYNADQISGSPLTPFVNRLINGNFAIDQRNSGAAVSISSATKAYAIDKWFGQGISAAGVFTMQREADSVNPGQYRLKLACTTADASLASGDLYFVGQRIEGDIAADLLLGTVYAKQVTISFEIETNIAGTFGISLRNSAANRAYVGNVIVNAVDTRETKTVTLTLDTSGTWVTGTGIGLEIAFCLAAGSTYHGAADAWGGSNIYTTSSQTNFMSANTNVMRLRNIQLQRGTVATEFHSRSLLEEWLCWRYFQLFDLSTSSLRSAFGQAIATTSAICWFPYYRKMRSVPSVTFDTASNYGVSDSSFSTNIALTVITTSTIGADRMGIACTVASGLTVGAACILLQKANSPFIKIDADL